MSRSPWDEDMWTERQAAWHLAGLQKTDFAPAVDGWKVEPDFDEATPRYAAEEKDWLAWKAGEISAADLAQRRYVDGWEMPGPPRTPEAESAGEWLNKMRRAVEWGDLETVGNRVTYWDGERGQAVRTTPDKVPRGALTRFKVRYTDLRSWKESVNASPTAVPTKQNVGGTDDRAGNNDAPWWWYVVPLRWAMALGKLDMEAEPRQVLHEIKKRMERRGLSAGRPNPNASNQREAVIVAREKSGVKLTDQIPTKSRDAAAGLFAYVAGLAGVDAENPEKLHAALLDAEVPTPGKDALATIAMILNR